MIGGSARELRPGHLVVGLAVAAVVGVAVVTGIGRVAGYGDLGDVVRDADARWLALCLAGQVVVFAGYAGVLRRAARSEGRPGISVGESVRVVLASFAATQLFGLAGVGGLAVVYWSLRQAGLERDEAAVRLIGLNTAVYLVFAVIGGLAALGALVRSSAPLGLTVPWIASVPLVVLVARWFTEPARAGRWAAIEHASVPGRALATGIAAARWVRGALGTSAHRPLFAWAGCYWLGDLASLWAAQRAFGAHLGVDELTLAYATGYLAQALPIPFIATGGMDAATTFLLQLVGMPLEAALGAVVAHRVFAFWLPVVPGSILALDLARRARAGRTNG